MKEIASYVYGSFNDYLGKEHKIIVCGVTKSEESEIAFRRGYEITCKEIQKTLSIGVSICNPNDEYDEEKGQMIAYNRALKEEVLLTSSRRGMFNTATVHFLLNDYLKYIERDPGSILKGYNDAEKAYHEKMDLLNDIQNFSKEDLNFLSKISVLTDEQISYAKKVCKVINERP